jgi:hypothetical protein
VASFPPRRALPAIAGCLLAGSVAGCGSGGDSTAPTVPAESQHTDRRPSLPAGWRRVVNPRAGYNFAVPPGWSARGGAGSTQLRSFDRALAGSVTADRSDQGLTLAPAVYARRAARSLSGYRGLTVGRPHRIIGVRYPTASVTATGTLRRTRIGQAIVVFALKPRAGATYSMVFFRSAAVSPDRYASLLATIVRSLRVQAPEQ